MIKLFPMALAGVATATLFVGTQLAAQTATEPAEMTRAAAETRAADAFERMDSNNDGQLNEADREAQARLRFNETDTDGNGQLSFAEVTAERESRQANREERRSEWAEVRGRGGPDGKRGNGRGMGGRMLERADADSNGSVSEAEFTTAALARFDRADANSDGTISADERRGDREGRRGHGNRSRG